MKMAHERDMTFNEFIETALRQVIDELKDAVPKKKKKKDKK
jgi:Fe-S cluster biogenesis protein NfuA